MVLHNISTISIRTTKHLKQTFPANFTSQRWGTEKKRLLRLRVSGEGQRPSPRREGTQRTPRGRRQTPRRPEEQSRDGEASAPETAPAPGRAPRSASRSAGPAPPGLTGRAGNPRAAKHKPPGPAAAPGPGRAGPPPHLVLDELLGAGVAVAEPRDRPRLEGVTTELGIAPAGPCRCRHHRALPAARSRRRGGGRRHRRLHRRTRN